MSKNNSFFQKINKYCQEANSDIHKKYDSTKNYVFRFEDPNIVNIYESNKDDNKLIFKCEYSVVGTYNIYNSIWYWSWAIDYINKTLINKRLIEDVKDYKPKKNSYSYQELDEIYFYTSNNNFYLSYQNINKLTNLVLYLTKGQMIIPVKYTTDGNTISYTENNGENNNHIKRLEYIMIEKVIQYGI